MRCHPAKIPFSPGGCWSFKEELLGQLWEGEGGRGGGPAKGGFGSRWRNPQAVEDLIGYLEKWCPYIPDYQQRQRAGLWIASTRVQRFNDWAVSGHCKHQGVSWSPQGVLALAALEVARRSGPNKNVEKYETVATLPGDLGLIPIAEALKSATSRTGGKPNVIARGPEPCSPGISRARSRIGPG